MVKKNHLVLLLSLVFFLTKPALSQIEVDDVVFDKEIFDFGNIAFGKNEIIATFFFTNNSEFDYQIKNVIASCGCTVPSWPKNPIRPGMKGVITAKFDPTNLAGEVDKTIEIVANYNKVMSKKLRIQGIIREPIKQDLSTYVPGQLGYIRLSTQAVGFNTVLNTKTYERQIRIVNDYNRPLKIKDIKEKPNYADIEFSAKDIVPGDTIIMKIVVHGNMIEDFGLVNDRILFETNDIFFSTKMLKIAMEVEPDFSGMSKKEMRLKPIIDIPTQTFDMGVVHGGAKSTASVTIRNTGKSTLKILKIKSDCSCTLISNLGSEILPGESVNAKITFDSIFLSGKAEKEIILFTNDPVRPKIILKVYAQVIEN